MQALKDFLHMGGYAFYVWTSYAIVCALLAINVWLALRRDRAVRARLRRLLGDPARGGAADRASANGDVPASGGADGRGG